MPIKLILTGGTIDQKYNELTGELGYDKTHIDEMLDQARSRIDLDVQKLMLLNSLDITNEQRQQILKTCKEHPGDQIVITHGTDTIVETASLLGKNIHDKTIVLLGSMIPFAFGDSDALFNLGAALTAVQTLRPGVYITMNGKIFDWDKVVKNRELGEFQAA
jgi:L-asparaginase